MSQDLAHENDNICLKNYGDIQLSCKLKVTAKLSCKVNSATIPRLHCSQRLLLSSYHLCNNIKCKCNVIVNFSVDYHITLADMLKITFSPLSIVRYITISIILSTIQ